MTHKHRKSLVCTCKPYDDEPDDKCPVHGIGEYPDKCDVCGQFFTDDDEDV